MALIRHFLIFSLSCLGALFFPKILFFSLFLVYSFYRCSRLEAMGLSFLCGAFLDCISFDTPFGLHIISLGMTTYILYPQKFNFFIDSLSTYPVLTFLFSSLLALITSLLHIPFGLSHTISFPFIMGDMILYPFLDAVASFILYTLPERFWGSKVKRGQEYFF